MSSKASLNGYSFAFAITAAALFAIVAPKPGLAQTPSPEATSPSEGTTSIERGSKAERDLKMKEPSFETREERLNAKPLDWNATIGKPNPKPVRSEEEETLRKAKPEQSEGGAPQPNSEEEARKLHPRDWE